MHAPGLRVRLSPLLLLGLLLLTGCTSLSVRHAPGVDLARNQRFFVIKNFTDNRDLAERITDDLRARGYEASCGPLTMMPDHNQILISYQDTWAWDFHTYLVELDMSAREAYSEKLLATASYSQPVLIPKRPSSVIHLLLNHLLKETAAAKTG